MQPFSSITTDISSICNARCTWCTTGIKNRGGNCGEAHFMSAEEFEKGIDYCLEKGIITADTMTGLYNYGEPFLNKEISDICGVLAKKGIPFHISTNASVFREIAPENLKTLTSFRVSLSGFSPRTYSKTHGLNFDMVMENILKFSEMLKKAGKLGTMNISFLTYKFNSYEIEAAREYFSSKGIAFVPRIAYYADHFVMKDFLTGGLNEELKTLGEEQVFNDLILERHSKAVEIDAANSYPCPQDDVCVFGSRWEVIPCCCFDSVHSVGSLFDFDIGALRRMKAESGVCVSCKRHGQHYIVHNLQEIYGGGVSLDKPSYINTATLYIDTGNGFSEAETKRVDYCPDGRVILEFTGFDKPLLALRFDPCEKSCLVRDIEVSADSEKLAPLNTNAEKTVTDSSAATCFFAGSDPQYIISPPLGMPSCIKISFDIVTGSASIVSSLI